MTELEAARRKDPCALAANEPDHASCHNSREATKPPAPWDADLKSIPEGVVQYHADMLANPALRASPAAPAALRAAPNAFNGVQLACLATDLPPMGHTDPSRRVVCEPYKLMPAVAKQADGSEAVVFWQAFNTETKRLEFIVGPGSVETFRTKAVDFARAAAAAYQNGEPDAVTRESMKAVEELANHGFGAGLKQVWKANTTAWSDPKWVAKTLLDTTIAVGGSGAARAAQVERRGAQGVAETRVATREANVAPKAAAAAEPKADLQRRRTYEPTTKGSATLDAGTGETNKYGDVTYSTKGTAKDIALAQAHESVHSFLSPKAMNGLREFRADLGMAAYQKSQLCRYLEEALAESYAQVKVNGPRSLPEGITFPITNGYVTLRGVAKEGAIGAVVVGGIAYGVYVSVRDQ